jgi:hypothetical protein
MSSRAQRMKDYRQKWVENHPEEAAACQRRRLDKNIKARAEARAIKVLSTPTDRKKCSRCKEEKLLDDFSKQSSGTLGHRSRCRECESVARKPNDPVKIKASASAWVKRNPGRARRNGRNNQARRRQAKGVEYYNEQEWESLLAATGRKCLCCGEPEATAIYSFRGGPQRGRLTPDHIKPVISGGTESIENIQPLCLPCNMKKGTNVIDYRSTSNRK